MTLLDDVKDLSGSAWCSPLLSASLERRLKALAPRARQFIFDKDASRLLGEFIAACPDVLVDQMQFARQPYDVTYIEVDLASVYEGTGKGSTAADYPEPDWKVGFLAHGGTVYSFANSHKRPTAYLSPLCVVDNEYAPNAKIDTIIDDSRVILGTTWHDLNEAQRAAVAQRFTMGYIGPADERDAALRIMLPAVMGEARVYLAALLFLYQKQHVTIRDYPFERKMARGKLRTYMGYSTVTIHLATPVEIRRAFSITDRASPRRHEVRTHYKHRELTPGCEHDWHRVEDADNEQWRCTKCAGLRYLCKEHVRGDSAIGFVNKNYHITL